MKPQRLSPCLFFLIGLCGLVLRFPLAQMAAEETPKPSATSGATGAAGISPTPSPMETPRVRWVGVRNWKGEQRKENVVYAQRGDKIWVDIINFKDWVNYLEKKPDSHEWKDLILYLDHIPLRGVGPLYSYEHPPNGIIRRNPPDIELGQLVFRLSAMTARSPGGRTSSTSRSSTAR